MSHRTSTPRRSPRKVVIDEPISTGGLAENEDSDEESLVQHQVKAFLQTVKHLEDDLKNMRKQNQQLHRQLDAFREAAPSTPRRRAAVNIEIALKMQELEAHVEELEEINSRLHKRLWKLKQKDLKAEVEELNNCKTSDEVSDRFDRMRKLLRRFSTWMSVTTLAEQEGCPICSETLKPTKAYALPCEHLVCSGCLPQISKGADETVRCPQCREIHGRERLQLLRYTETQRWDSLLLIARQSTRLDQGGGTTSSEEDEENFIDDGDDDDEDSRSDPSDRDEIVIDDASVDQVKKEEEEDPVFPSTPSSSGVFFYAESPTSEKRKRLESLALSRVKRKRVI